MKGLIKLLLEMAVAAICSLALAFLAGCLLAAVFADQHRINAADGSGVLLFGEIFAWGASLFTLPAILILSIPLHLVADMQGLVRGRNYAGAGALIAVAVFLAIQLIARITLLDFAIPPQMAVPAFSIAPLLGAAAGLGFWAVVRPDKAKPTRSRGPEVR